ncbi:hypothetical protein [Hymenobacter cheonanensis]|uniref:hypothetical protein n=1 Tax=Hymenobacter sp. CA2-7 TaxID=3063993 RepID=UPI0027140927|nr:hypothetical protein [Hymenobacter sp. CA2-7]MDO7886298.1 hypothetical protein [Hymenobacter sp. CA2-7]
MRFLLRFQLTMLLAAAGGLALLFGLRDYASLAALVRQPRFGPYFRLVPTVEAVALTPGRYQALRVGLVAVALLAAGGLAGLAWYGRGRRAAARPPGSSRPRRLPVQRALAPLLRPGRQLSGPERGLAAVLLGAVALARLYYAGYYPLSLDEVASYDFYTLPGAAVTASYYPFPNNHLLANLLVGLVHGLLPGAPPALALRLLPTAGGLLALPLVYVLALRYLRFGVATLGLGLYWLSPLGVYYAVAGRGYAWELPAALAGLYATAELLRPQGLRRPGRQLAWAVFGWSGLLGLYAVPTHLYVLLGLGLGLLVGFGRQPARLRRRRLGHLAVATLGIAAGAGVLYAPVGAVTGWPALLANRYVARHAWPEFYQGLGPWLVGTATELLGQRGLSAVAFCLVLGLAPAALRRGRLPEPTRRLGWLLLGQLGLWLPLLLVQRVYPPARTLLPVLLAFFLLAGVLGQAAWAWGRATWPAGSPGLRPARWPAGTPGHLALALVLAAYGGYRLLREQAVLAAQVRQQQQLRRAYGWLQSQGLRRIWVEPRAYALFWQHYALSAGQRPLPLVGVYDAPGTRPGPAGEVEVLAPGPLAPGAGRPVRYRSEQVLVVPVSPSQPLLQDQQAGPGGAGAQ